MLVLFPAHACRYGGEVRVAEHHVRTSCAPHLGHSPGPLSSLFNCCLTRPCNRVHGSSFYREPTKRPYSDRLTFRQTYRRNHRRDTAKRRSSLRVWNEPRARQIPAKGGLSRICCSDRAIEIVIHRTQFALNAWRTSLLRNHENPS